MLKAQQNCFVTIRRHRKPAAKSPEFLDLDILKKIKYAGILLMRACVRLKIAIGTSKSTTTDSGILQKNCNKK